MQASANSAHPTIHARYQAAIAESFMQTKRAETFHPKHQKFFAGRDLYLDDQVPMDRLVAQKMAADTKERMTRMGEANYDRFVTPLANTRHHLVRSMAFGLIPGHVSHGACRFGETVSNVGKTIDVVRFFVTNGDIEIDPEMGDRYLRLKDRHSEKFMFYGLAQTLDRDGRFMRLNQNRFDNAVAFLTDDPKEAFVNIAAHALKKDIADIRAKMTQNKAAQPEQTASAPRI